MKYVVCYSGGHSSALVAIETVRKHGKQNVILLNHDISPNVEHEDIKRFKKEVAIYLGMEITPANMDGWEEKDQFDVCVEAGGWKFGNNMNILCTTRLKTEPFAKWLKENYPSEPFRPRNDLTILYGFDKGEEHRMTRRVGILASQGYFVDFPLAMWERTITTTEEIGIPRPIVYQTHRHANCMMCLKSGKLGWYVSWLERPDLLDKAIWAENEIGYTIFRDESAIELKEKFERMRCQGFNPTEYDSPQKFWTSVAKYLDDNQLTMFPCECSL